MYPAIYMWDDGQACVGHYKVAAVVAASLAASHMCEPMSNVCYFSSISYIIQIVYSSTLPYFLNWWNEHNNQRPTCQRLIISLSSSNLPTAHSIQLKPLGSAFLMNSLCTWWTQSGIHQSPGWLSGICPCGPPHSLSLSKPPTWSFWKSLTASLHI